VQQRTSRRCQSAEISGHSSASEAVCRCQAHASSLLAGCGEPDASGCDSCNSRAGFWIRGKGCWPDFARSGARAAGSSELEATAAAWRQVDVGTQALTADPREERAAPDQTRLDRPQLRRNPSNRRRRRPGRDQGNALAKTWLQIGGPGFWVFPPALSSAIWETSRALLEHTAT